MIGLPREDETGAKEKSEAQSKDESVTRYGNHKGWDGIREVSMVMEV
jgi:hypothetical protein